jgi:cell division protein ZapE
MPQSVKHRYEVLARSGEIAADDSQRALAAELDALLLSLDARWRRSKKSALGWLLSREPRAAPPRGLYIFGAVGGGKTLLMDLFYDAASSPRKRRAHFHAFMADVHDRADRLRREPKNGAARNGDPIAAVADDIAAEIDLLCFDEFAVTDIADAMILGRLFEQLFARNVVVVATSNSAPDDLYKDGLNRALFVPFIEMLRRRMTVFHLDAPQDYRLTTTGDGRRYVNPLGHAAAASMDAHFRRLTGHAIGEPAEIANKGRRIAVPQAASGVARFSFAELCSRPLAASDYRALAKAFHTIMLENVPVLEAARRNEAKRFINLVDVLYDARLRLIVSAAAEPHDLWTGVTGSETAEFQRTASRLIEMRSDAYWEAASRGAEKKEARAI